MKRLLICIILLSACLCVDVHAQSVFEIQCIMYAVRPDVKGEIPEDDPIKRRKPTGPLICEISEERGVVFLSGSNPEILYFEIHDSEDVVMTFDDQESFIKTLFSMSGKVEILIATPLWHYIGYVEL